MNKASGNISQKNTKTGKIVMFNMEEMIKDIENLIGKSYIKNE